jgi:hypothetical protein
VTTVDVTVGVTLVGVTVAVVVAVVVTEVAVVVAVVVADAVVVVVLAAVGVTVAVVVPVAVACNDGKARAGVAKPALNTRANRAINTKGFQKRCMIPPHVRQNEPTGGETDAVGFSINYVKRVA